MLDSGCGAGLLLLRLAALNHIREGLGVDINACSVTHATRAAERLQAASPLQFTQANDVTSSTDSQWDVVTLIDVMHHVPPEQQYALFIWCIHRLSRDGMLIYKDMCERPWWRALANRLHDLLVSRQWIRYVPVRHIEQWAGEHGLQLVHASNHTHLVYGHELRVFSRPVSPSNGTAPDSQPS